MGIVGRLGWVRLFRCPSLDRKGARARRFLEHPMPGTLQPEAGTKDIGYQIC